MTAKTIEPGDCTLSLAAAAGLFFETVWNDPANAALKAKRKFPTILMPGDVLEVREPVEKREDGASTNRHTFVLRGVPARLRLRLRVRGKPLAGKSVTLTVDGDEHKATPDGDGRVDIPIDPRSAVARLQVEGEPGEYLLQLGFMTPIDETSGLQARLFNLGFDPRGIDNDYGKNTRIAMQAFQKAHDLKRTDKPDAATRGALEAEYGC